MWTRPPGPPKIWKIIDIVDSNGAIRKFSLQEIPEERYDEALQHMRDYFLTEEIICSALNVADEPASVEFSRKSWALCLIQGISIGAYEITDSGALVLAGINIIFYMDEEVEKCLKAIESGPCRIDIFMRFTEDMLARVDPRKLYGVDNYLAAFGLSIHPNYRRLGLARRLLELRDDIGKMYNIQYTTTIFTSEPSQKAAKSVNFELDLEGTYDKAVDAVGNPLLPQLSGVTWKVMHKQIF